MPCRVRFQETFLKTSYLSLTLTRVLTLKIEYLETISNPKPKFKSKCNPKAKPDLICMPHIIPIPVNTGHGMMSPFVVRGLQFNVLFQHQALPLSGGRELQCQYNNNLVAVGVTRNCNCI